MVYSRCKGKIRRSHLVQMGRKLLKSYGEILERQLLSKSSDKRRLFYVTDFLAKEPLAQFSYNPQHFTLLTYVKREKVAFFQQNNTTSIETKIFDWPECFFFVICSLISLLFSFNAFQDLIFTSLFFLLKVVYTSAGYISLEVIISP